MEYIFEMFLIGWYRITNPKVRCCNGHEFSFRKLKSVQMGYDYYELSCPICGTRDTILLDKK